MSQIFFEAHKLSFVLLRAKLHGIIAPPWAHEINAYIQKWTNSRILGMFSPVWPLSLVSLMGHARHFIII